MNDSVLWLIIWIVLLFVTPLFLWAGGLGSAIAAYHDKAVLAVSSFLTGIILSVLWFILVAYNIVMQIITLVNGG